MPPHVPSRLSVSFLICRCLYQRCCTQTHTQRHASAHTHTSLTHTQIQCNSPPHAPKQTHTHKPLTHPTITPAHTHTHSTTNTQWRKKKAKYMCKTHTFSSVLSPSSPCTVSLHTKCSPNRDEPCERVLPRRPCSETYGKFTARWKLFVLAPPPRQSPRDGNRRCVCVCVCVCVGCVCGKDPSADVSTYGYESLVG